MPFMQLAYHLRKDCVPLTRYFRQVHRLLFTATLITKGFSSCYCLDYYSDHEKTSHLLNLVLHHSLVDTLHSLLLLHHRILADHSTVMELAHIHLRFIHRPSFAIGHLVAAIMHHCCRDAGALVDSVGSRSHFPRHQIVPPLRIVNHLHQTLPNHLKSESFPLLILNPIHDTVAN